MYWKYLLYASRQLCVCVYLLYMAKLAVPGYIYIYIYGYTVI